MSDNPEDEFVRVQKIANMSKWRAKKRAEGYERPGRVAKAEKRYCGGKTHVGKTKTLRDHRAAEAAEEY